MQSMISKSGYRFSDKTMLKLNYEERASAPSIMSMVFFTP